MRKSKPPEIPESDEVRRHADKVGITTVEWWVLFALICAVLVVNILRTT